jgi:hypothetical protein
MKGATNMDEHDPRWVAPADEWEDIPSPLWAVVGGVAMALLLALLAGCDDFDRKLAEQEFRQRVFNACTPEEGQRIVVVRDKDSLHFTTIDLSAGRYGRTFPHTEIRVATVN